MNIVLHQAGGLPVAEFVSDSVLIRREQDVILLLEELFENGARCIILHQSALDPAFFQLRSGLAGAVLQKLVIYEMRVAVVGDFSNVTSDSLRAFIYESNRGSQVFFVGSVEEALQKFSSQGV